MTTLRTLWACARNHGYRCFRCDGRGVTAHGMARHLDGVCPTCRGTGRVR